MILIDTNVLLRSAQPSHSQYTAAKDAVKEVRMRGYVPCIVPQVLYEFWVVATRPAAENGLGQAAAEAEADLRQLIRQFGFFRDERAIFDRWHRLVVEHVVHGRSAHDARLVAAMERHGIRHLLTFNDRHFRRFPAIHIIHPSAAATLAHYGGEASAQR